MTTDANGISVKTGKISIKGKENPVIKTKIIETTEKYDKDGKLVEKITIKRISEYDEGGGITRGVIRRDKTSNPIFCDMDGRNSNTIC